MRTCIIAANGKSLNDYNYDIVNEFPLFILNRGYLKKELKPRWLVVVNDLVIKQFWDEISQVDVDTIFATPIYNHPRLFPLRYTPDIPSFQPDITKPLWQGHTVTYVALQIAYWMGFEKVILIGLDHNYPRAKGKPSNQLVVSDSEDIDHFDKNYFGKGVKWHLPNLERSELAYKLARDYYERNGRIIINATPQTKLDVFPVMTLEEAINYEISN